MRTGHLALILHAHLPFVRHPEHENFLEEDWLFEAITETYIPLISMMQRLAADRVPFKLTMSVTPTLAAMLNDELLRDRYVRHIDGLIQLASSEIERNKNDAKLRELSCFYHEQFSTCRRLFVDDWQRDLPSQFRALRDLGVLEPIGCAATHAVLPLFTQTPETVRAQILTGRDEFARTFGAEPAGWWLAECAYSPRLDPVLQEANIRWFVVDAHGLMFANPRPRRAIYAPCYTPAGPAAFARDRESSRQIWSAHEGYPGDPAYREFYRDIGFELSPEKFGAAAPRFTGIKYHRVTGRTGEKQLYDRRAAERAADAHAAHFLRGRTDHFHELLASGFDPIIVAPFDAELFGHWWYEGPVFLERFIRKLAEASANFALTTPTEYLRANPTQQTVVPAESTWGANGYFEVWMNGKNSWIYPHLHAAAKRMTQLARERAATASVHGHRVLKQLARELLLAQSSDWPFLIHSGTATHYATRRAKDHLLRFNRLYDQYTRGAVDDEFLAACEMRDNLFADVDWRYYI